MTNEAPARMWAYEAFQQVTAARSPTWFPAWAEPHEYVRADHLKAAVAAENEACAQSIEKMAERRITQDMREMLLLGVKAIRARADADALAALEAVKREARNEALREAASLIAGKAHVDGELHRGRLQAPGILSRAHDTILALLDKEPGQ